MRKRVYELTHAEARLICSQQDGCDSCPLLAVNGCLRSVAGFTKKELFRIVEVKDYD